MAIRKIILFALACAGAAQDPLPKASDWWAYAGDSLHDGWLKGEQGFAKADLKDFRLLWQRDLDESRHPASAFLPPLILSNLSGVHGPEEVAIVAGQGNSFWAIDTEVNHLIWEKHFDSHADTQKKKSKHVCGAGITAVPVVSQSSGARSKDLRPVFLLTSDGLLRQINPLNGVDVEKPRRIMPSGLAEQTLNAFDESIYTTTRAGCGHPATVWALDTLEASDPEARPKSIKLGADVAGLGGIVLDSQGKAFLTTDSGPLDPAAGRYSGSLVELDQNLNVIQYFILPEPAGKESRSPGMNITSPAVFMFEGVQMVATTGKDGRLYLLKANDLGTLDHHHYISKSVLIPAMDGRKAHGIWGGLSSWEDGDGTRYLLMPVWGPLSEEMQAAVPDANAPNGSIVVFKLRKKSGERGVIELLPVWVSPDLESPSPPVIAQGIVFALANGRFSHTDKGASPRKGTHAQLFAFDGTKGKLLFASGDQIASAGNLSGLSLANGHVYFQTAENTLLVFGKKR